MRLSGTLNPSAFSVILAAFSLSMGCGPAAPPSTGAPPRPGDEKSVLRVLVIDDDELASSIGEQWKVRATEEEIDVRAAASKDLAGAKRLSADVVVFPARWMGELAERDLIQPIPETMLLAGTDSEDGSPKIMLYGYSPGV